MYFHIKVATSGNPPNKDTTKPETVQSNTTKRNTMTKKVEEEIDLTDITRNTSLPTLITVSL